MGQFKLMGQEISPQEEQGWGVNSIKDEWVSVADDWTDLNLSATPNVPLHEVDCDDPVQVTTYTNCASVETAAVWNETREKDNADQVRVRVQTTQFYDVSDISAIDNLNAELYQVATLPTAGYNDDTPVGLDLDGIYYPYCFVLVGYSIIPLQQIGGKMARVKFTWEIWNDWRNL